MTLMTGRAHAAAAAVAGLDITVPYAPLMLDDLARYSHDRVVYAALAFGGNVDYVGSACRPGNLWTAVCRLREHLAEPDKDRVWYRFTVWPCPADWSEQQVRTAEGAIGRYLAPTRKQRLPRIG